MTDQKQLPLPPKSGSVWVRKTDENRAIPKKARVVTSYPSTDGQGRVIQLVSVVEEGASNEVAFNLVEKLFHYHYRILLSTSGSDVIQVGSTWEGLGNYEGNTATVTEVTEDLVTYTWTRKFRYSPRRDDNHWGQNTPERFRQAYRLVSNPESQPADSEARNDDVALAALNQLLHDAWDQGWNAGWGDGIESDGVSVVTGENPYPVIEPPVKSWIFDVSVKATTEAEARAILIDKADEHEFTLTDVVDQEGKPAADQA